MLAELGPEPEDLVLTRTHGLDPMAGTDLDPVLRNLGVRTIVVTGVSVNVAVTNLVMDAVNRGYDVVLPRDAVCGIPQDYADAVIDNTLALLATITTTDDLIGGLVMSDGHGDGHPRRPRVGHHARAWCARRPSASATPRRWSTATCA